MENKEFFDNYIKLFLEQNSKMNLISKNDEKFLWEKHIFDSLALGKVFEKYGIPKELLDIGTGGGFPSVPIAIKYPQINVCAIDSIRKKINAVSEISSNLGIKNLEAICDRVENFNRNFDFVTSRAVASLDKISQYALSHTRKGGYFAAFKSRKALEEIENSKVILKKFGAKIIDIIEYKLPLDEIVSRNIIVIQK